jgi:hypothetical protein
MWDRDCGSVPVVDPRRPGRRNRDRSRHLYAAYFQGKPLSAIPLTSIMSSDVRTARRRGRHGSRTDDASAQGTQLPVTNVRAPSPGLCLSVTSLSPSRRNGAAQQTKGESRDLLETLAEVTEPRKQAVGSHR